MNSVYIFMLWRGCPNCELTILNNKQLQLSYEYYFD